MRLDATVGVTLLSRPWIRKYLQGGAVYRSDVWWGATPSTLDGVMVMAGTSETSWDSSVALTGYDFAALAFNTSTLVTTTQPPSQCESSSNTTSIIVGTLGAVGLVVSVVGLCYCCRRCRPGWDRPCSNRRLKVSWRNAKASRFRDGHYRHEGVDGFVLHVSSSAGSGVTKIAPLGGVPTLPGPPLATVDAAAFIPRERLENDQVRLRGKIDDSKQGLPGDNEGCWLDADGGNASAITRTPASKAREGSPGDGDQFFDRTVDNAVYGSGNDLCVDPPEKNNTLQSPEKPGLTEAMMDAAETMAQASTVPGISEVAALMGVLLRQSVDRQTNVELAEPKARWCRSVMVLLKKAEAVLVNVSLSVTVCVKTNIRHALLS